MRAPPRRCPGLRSPGTIHTTGHGGHHHRTAGQQHSTASPVVRWFWRLDRAANRVCTWAEHFTVWTWRVAARTGCLAGWATRRDVARQRRHDR
jgi:hypothetical protein